MASPSRSSPWGCIAPLLAGLWVLTITFATPIGADRYHASLGLKLLVTIGHTAAIFALLYPSARKTTVDCILGILGSLWAIMTVVVVWYWN